MRTVVIYDSVYGNTEQVARAIGRGAAPSGDVRVLSVDEAGAGEAIAQAGHADLLFVGGPTQRHGLSPKLKAFLGSLSRGSMRGTGAASFDTRYRMAALLTGSAARDAAGRLRRAGSRLVVPPESFFMERDLPPEGEKRRHELEKLEPGELERAEEWGRTVAAAVLSDPRPDAG
jgi:flavodoxin